MMLRNHPSKTHVERVGYAAACVLLLIALVPRAIIAWTLPLGTPEQRRECAPDEGLHFWTVMHYADGDLATWPESGSIYSAYPPAPYALHAVLLRTVRGALGNGWPSRFPSSWWRLQSYTAARLGGMLLGCVTVLCATFTAQIWSRSRRLAIASGLAVALYPQLVFIDSYVNGDSYTVAAVAGLVVTLSRWATAGEGTAGVRWVGAAAGLVLLGKPNGYAALVPTAVWLLDALRRRRIGFGTFIMVGGTSVLVAAPVLVWNGLRNEGDLLGLGRYRELLTTEYHPQPSTGFFADRVPWFLWELGRSAFGVFRNANLPLPSLFYLGAVIFALIGLVAGVRTLRQTLRRSLAARAALWLTTTLALGVAVVFWNSWAIDHQPQGRYLLPAIIPIATAVTAAFGQMRPGGRVLLASWLGFLAVATATAVAMIYANPCLG